MAIEVSAAKEFAAIARSFCETIEDVPGLDRHGLLWRLGETLPLLYAAAFKLPDLEPESEEAAPSALSDDEWRAVTARLGEAFGDSASYVTVAEPLERDEAAVFGDLTDDLGDIYRDLKVGLRVLADGSPRDAVWEWRFGFATHWGRHTVEALRAIHALLEQETGFGRREISDEQVT